MKTHFYSTLFSLFITIFLIIPCFSQKLDIEVTTKSYGGNQAPKTALGIWIQSTQNKHIKTLGIWGIDPSYMLRNWRIITGIADTGVFDTSTFDGLAAATRMNHNDPINIQWNCKDSSGNIVDDGDYEFWVEMQEQDYWWGPTEPYPGRVTHGTITIDNQAKVVYGDTSDTCFSDFKATYDPTIGIIYSGKKHSSNTSFSYWYNPTIGELTVTLNSSIDRFAVIQIFDLKGTLINKASPVGQSNKFTWNIRDIYGKKVPSGIYVFEVRSNMSTPLASAHTITVLQ